ncbi:DUF305 domain-containing protein [Natronococcus sp. A-GB7]|uniref:DUF305 domain-containing protein n=1 Tax=Natronococcus sp. A-GB7 TaxID=3037649 RepID=UPI00241EBFEA|nr:DUF305 domain-containing protein [Natronococcus sp. A-GB7]MDG5818557.1 DUF305 domain-containing protein [Natronococcus sp. A-GB7]
MRRTTRRRVLAVTGATTAGLAGLATADDHGDDENHDHDGETDDHEHHDDDHEHHDDDHEHHNDDHEYHDDGEFNDADVAFMQGMIPHHEQAIEMAELVPDRTDSRRLCDLAPEIIEVQEAEIEQLQEWLEEAGADAGGDHDHDEMEGMLSDEELTELREAEGQEFDCLFAEQMIFHHEGAIEMAEDVLEGGRAERVADLAEEIIAVQREEIEMMECWRDDWGC